MANCRFIFTCNFINKIIEPLHSRCTVVDFQNQTQEQATGLQGQFLCALKTILDHEQIQYEDKVLAKKHKALLPLIGVVSLMSVNVMLLQVVSTLPYWLMLLTLILTLCCLL